MIVYITERGTERYRELAILKSAKIEEELQELGFEVINPLRLLSDHSLDFTKAMKTRIEAMMKADVVYMSDYLNSGEMAIERSIALNIGMPMYFSIFQLVKYRGIVKECEEL